MQPSMMWKQEGINCTFQRVPVWAIKHACPRSCPISIARHWNALKRCWLRTRLSLLTSVSTRRSNHRQSPSLLPWKLQRTQTVVVFVATTTEAESALKWLTCSNSCSLCYFIWAASNEAHFSSSLRFSGASIYLWLGTQSMSVRASFSNWLQFVKSVLWVEIWNFKVELNSPKNAAIMCFKIMFLREFSTVHL